MEGKTLIAEQRKRANKGEARRLRVVGKIPAIIYGHTKPLPIAIDEREFNSKFHELPESTIIQIKVDGDSHDVLIRDFQEDIVTGKLLHLDFYEIEKGKILRAKVPLHLIGAAVGVKEGGLLETSLHELEVECLPRDLPARIEIDISGLQLGHSLHVREAPIPQGVKAVNAADQVVCTVVHKRVEVAPVAAAEAALAEGEEEAATEEQKEASQEE